MALDFKEELKKLRKSLSGHYAQVVEEYNQANPGKKIHFSTVHRVLAGEWVNKGILEAAVKVRDRVREQEQDITKLIAE